MKNLLVLGAASLVLAGCMSGAGYRVAETSELVPQESIEPYAEWPEGFEGRTVEIETDEGHVNQINFAPNGVVTALVDPGAPVIEGYYGLRDGWVCINFSPRGEECWQNVQLMEGETQMLTSNRGQTLKVTMIDNEGRWNRD